MKQDAEKDWERKERELLLEPQKKQEPKSEQQRTRLPERTKADLTVASSRNPIEVSINLDLPGREHLKKKAGSDQGIFHVFY